MTAKSKIKITPTHITYCTMFFISISGDAVASGECGETLFYCVKMFCTFQLLPSRLKRCVYDT